jgi:hypothetical protein
MVMDETVRVSGESAGEIFLEKLFLGPIYVF